MDRRSYGISKVNYAKFLPDTKYQAESQSLVAFAWILKKLRYECWNSSRALNRVKSNDFSNTSVFAGLLYTLFMLQQIGEYSISSAL